MPISDPATALLADPNVAEARRFCTRCDEPVGRGRDGRPGRLHGWCRRCGAPFSFVAKLAPGDLVAGQYQVSGCLAHGGLGWIYLARDRNVADRWVVLKGLLDSADEDSRAAALAERRFLAEVEHANIVKIHNFVEHGRDGYIVMEYIGGRSLRQVLEARRAANGGRFDPLPAEQAMAYCLEILPALGHLHDMGLVFCDLKPDNVIQSHRAVKLIDLGGVYRMSDQDSPVWGTIGYQAPEIAETGPTVASDLFTVGRMLAALCVDVPGFQGRHRYTLPGPDEVEVFDRFGSLYAFLTRATAADPDERFQTADEMGAQLLGVLREIVAARTGSPAAGVSATFSPPGRAVTDVADWRTLPHPLVDSDDPRAALFVSLAAADPEAAVAELAVHRGTSVEVDVWLARVLLALGRLDEAGGVLDDVLRGDPWEWRARWYRGVAALAANRTDAATAEFASVYRAVPGELAPKLALGLTAESAADLAAAESFYDTVSRTDRAFTTATFGLARCRAGLGDRRGAVDAYARVPETSNAFVDAQLAMADVLLNAAAGGHRLDDVQNAAAVVDRLRSDDPRRAAVRARVLDATLDIVGREGDDPAAAVLGVPTVQRELRAELERTYRHLARRVPAGDERVALVEAANGVRVRTLL